MIEEIVDIVDENDNVISTATRTEAQQQDLRHRLALVCIFNNNGDMLVQWRSATKSTAPRQFTASCVETVASGETYAQAAKRGMQEELGIDIDIEEVAIVAGSHNRNYALYIGEYDGDVTGWEEEADIIDYWSGEEADFMRNRFPYLIAPGFIDVLDILLEMEDDE